MDDEYIIHLQTYAGSSDFEYRMTCSGREIEKRDALNRGIITPLQVHCNENSSYLYDWYAVKPGDVVTCTFYDDRVDEVEEVYVFRIEDTGFHQEIPERPEMYPAEYTVHCLFEQCQIMRATVRYRYQR